MSHIQKKVSDPFNSLIDKKLSKNEIAFIESMILPMESNDEQEG